MCSIVLITGPPGVGKTTLVHKIWSKLREKNVTSRGFYTEEVRGENGQRIGFDVVTLAGKRGILSRENPADHTKRPQVGKYSVYVQDFEALALPLLIPKAPGSDGELLIIDEVGKMELFSKRFESAVRDLLQQKTPLVITIPQKGSLPLVEQLKKCPGAILRNVTKANREALVKEITDLIEKSLIVTK
ncbi:nucleoside-triphosphatase THEP1 [Drosophila bipectinata]|uniref:nucleoside-triphosphatase THEP1 n=1 Tax=Drosophila bipectinata TaxID=42026 RepID=UPI001C8AC2A6|nr:nucleoside-triphosphatase THEP1 [Drosophila bipectinata]